MCIPELFYLCLYREVARAGVWLELPLYPGHVVVGQLRYALTIRGPVPRRRIEVEVYASGNFSLAARGRITRLQGR